jgi:hypothetical protein
MGAYDVQKSKKFVMKTVPTSKISEAKILNFSGQIVK